MSYHITQTFNVMVEGAYYVVAGGVAVFAASAFSYDSVVALVAGIFGGLALGASIAIPRLMPAIQAMQENHLNYKAKKLSMQLAADVERDEKMKGSYSIQIEELREQSEHLRSLLERAEREREDIYKDNQANKEMYIRLLERVGLSAGLAVEKIDEVKKAIGGDRVFVVEDDKATRTSMCSLMNKSGYQCSSVSSYPEAISVLENKNFRDELTFVILDLMLPGGSGIKILDHVKSLKLKAKVIIVTGANDEGMLDDAWRKWADHVAMKPVAISELMAKMSELKGRAPRPTSTDVDMAVLNATRHAAEG